MRWIFAILFLGVAANAQSEESANQFEIYVLGNAQDAGHPQAGCFKPHCVAAWKDPLLRRSASSLAVFDHGRKQFYLFDATPDIREQLWSVHQYTGDKGYRLNGVFITHAHIGHYAGLMHLGREAMNATKVPVYVMPRMAEFLKRNGPWSQLVTLENIQLKELFENEWVSISPSFSVKPAVVPHRDEFSETVGFEMKFAQDHVLYLPDIDKWNLWQTDAAAYVKNMKYAFIDATFFSETELPGRNIAEIPHPLIIESMAVFAELDAVQKSSIQFIHLNHSNPALDPKSGERRQLEQRGYSVAEQGRVYSVR